ncbi:MgtC/SapB family protein [Chryseolinea sp. T2]|uniref:MgtC/SapB family protein n=1 Tax=Chryseolinea sp. T2 TaxID=3129255 RepID=UPI003078971A
MGVNYELETAIQLVISFFIGAIIGAEREYRTKTAGLRTMIMISLGSTIFTEVSITMGVNSPDRIASNIVTGIGFLGAGVIFKDGLSISGITTATTIWITAALGMSVGAGQYFIALGGTVVVVIVLSVFEVFSNKINRMHQERTYKITFAHYSDFERTIMKRVSELNLSYKKEREMKTADSYVLVFHLRGSEKRLDNFNGFLKESDQVSAYEY